MEETLAADKVALIDLDGSTADYDRAMREQLLKIRSPDEPVINPEDDLYDNTPPWLEERIDLIKRQPGFWRTLPPIAVGLEICHLLEELSYRLMVLTKGPKNTTSAWTEKVEWCALHLPDAGVTIVRDSDPKKSKALTYGKVLYDDYPPYILHWLARRPRGRVIMLDAPHNKNFIHPQVLRVHRDLRMFTATDVRSAIINHVTGAT